jgi:predicted Zn-dependent protease
MTAPSAPACRAAAIRFARRRRISLALVAVILASGCAINPVSGRPEFTLLSEAKERQIGEEEAKNVAAEIGLYDDAALVEYVGTVGARLVGAAPHRNLTYTFHVVDMEEPNAFALPGGPVYVSRGLLALINDEDELAGVLAHEIAHVAAKHAVRRVSRAVPLAVVTGLGAAVTGIVSPTLGRLVGGVGGLAGALVLAPYSRGQEREADLVGQEIVVRAGWDPAGLSRSLHTLEREEALHGGSPRAMSFFATHPPLPRRVADTEDHARELAPGRAGRVADPDAFLRRLDGLPIGPRAADGVFDGSLFLHPVLGFHIRFPDGWETANERVTVGAVAPDRSALVGLELEGTGDDPEASLHALERESGKTLSAERLTIAGRPAVHVAALARTPKGPVAVDVTWIAFEGQVYRVTGLTRPETYDATRAVFAESAGSFGALTSTERAGIRETRLRLIAAHRDETLGGLLGRSGSTWSPEVAAVANGVDAAAALPQGRLVKVAVSEPYASR